MVETKINLLNNVMFKAICSHPNNRKMVAEFLSEVTGVQQERLEQASYQVGDIPKEKIEEGNITDLIIKIEDDHLIVLEMSRYSRMGSPKIILVNLDDFNLWNTRQGILDFESIDEKGHIETDMYELIHIIFENIMDEKYDNTKVKKFVEFITCKTIEEMKKRYEGDEEYMAAVRTVEELSKDPDFIKYYDIEEAYQQELKK